VENYLDDYHGDSDFFNQNKTRDDLSTNSTSFTDNLRKTVPPPSFTLTDRSLKSSLSRNLPITARVLS
jgi:hypothetical protein